MTFLWFQMPHIFLLIQHIKICIGIIWYFYHFLRCRHIDRVVYCHFVILKSIRHRLFDLYNITFIMIIFGLEILNFVHLILLRKQYMRALIIQSHFNSRFVMGFILVFVVLPCEGAWVLGLCYLLIILHYSIILIIYENFLVVTYLLLQLIRVLPLNHHIVIWLGMFLVLLHRRNRSFLLIIVLEGCLGVHYLPLILFTLSTFMEIVVCSIFNFIKSEAADESTGCYLDRFFNRTQMLSFAVAVECTMTTLLHRRRLIYISIHISDHMPIQPNKIITKSMSFHGGINKRRLKNLIIWQMLSNLNILSTWIVWIADAWGGEAIGFGFYYDGCVGGLQQYVLSVESVPTQLRIQNQNITCLTLLA